MSSFEPELGQAVFGNTQWEAHEMQEHVQQAIGYLAAAVSARSGDESMAFNVGGEFVNDVFALRAYCWCDGDEHPDGCPPNFAYGDFTCAWYKHLRRGASQSRPLTVPETTAMLVACLESLR